MPLLFCCLKLALSGDKESDIENLHLIGNLTDFRKSDPDMELLGTKHAIGVYKTVEMIARLYVTDSCNYPDEAQYWLNYAH